MQIRREKREREKGRDVRRNKRRNGGEGSHVHQKFTESKPQDLTPFKSLRVAREQHRLDRILQSFALHEVCHAQPLSRSRYIHKLYMCTQTYTRTFLNVLFEAFDLPQPLQLRPTERKMSITRPGRQQRICDVWYMIRKANGSNRTTGVI